MQCVRCGALVEGRFCPRCGMPAEGPTPPAGTGYPCPRCGTGFLGNFCPRCGLPTAAWAHRSTPPSSGGRSVLSVLWTLAMAGFLILVITDFAGLALSPALIVPGIQGLSSGQTVNSALDFDGNWTFDPWSTGSTGSHQPTGGNPGGFLRTTLFGAGARGFWMQPFRVSGSPPYTASVQLDMNIAGGASSGRLLISVESSPSVPDQRTAIGDVVFTGPSPWTATETFRADTQIVDPGLYYLKIAFLVLGASAPVDVGFDNIRLRWTTDAGVVFYVAVPAFVPLFVSQDKSLFLGYYAFIVASIVLAAAYHAIRERRETWNAIRAPFSSIHARLRSRSAWIAVGQVWMAFTFFQVVVVILVTLVGIDPASPIPPITARNAWVWLYELANAGVYEEIVFRVLLIGAPMAIGSVIVRIMEVNRGRSWDDRGAAGRHIAGAWRYLLGGVLRRNSPKEALVAGWVFLVASSAIFGLAHAPGWGSWKVLPAAVAGLGFGYLFLRHGVGAAILAHFVNDYILALYYEGVGGFALEAFISLLFLGLAIAGAGFFVWYGIEAWRHLVALLARFRPPVRAPLRATPSPYGSAAPPASQEPGSGTVPAPPSPFGPPARAETWPGGAGPPMPMVATADPGRIPRDYVPAYLPPPYGYPPVRFQCPSCGWVEARYESGRFTCLRCGRAA